MTTPTKTPSYRTGKICYIEIPATDIRESAEFYERSFGWQSRLRASTTADLSGRDELRSPGSRRREPTTHFRQCRRALLSAIQGRHLESAV